MPSIDLRSTVRRRPADPAPNPKRGIGDLLRRARVLADLQIARSSRPTFEAVRRQLELGGSEDHVDMIDFVKAFTEFESRRRLGLDATPVIVGGRYRLDERISGGGMGIVYRAWDDVLHCDVALKLLRVRGEEAVRQAETEARTMAQVRHPNVAMVFHVGEVGGQPYIVMEFIPGATGAGEARQGETLVSWRGRVRPDQARILGMYLAIGRGFVAIHGAGIVHGDFKPDNVLVDHDGRPRVIDFGLAVRLGDGPLGFTPEYVAPEQCDEPSVTTFASDQYSFCVALFEDLLGGHPYSSQTFEEFAATTRSREQGVTPETVRQRYIEQIRHNQRAGAVRWPRQLRRIPGWLRKTLQRGLSPDPGRRFPDMAALLAILDRARVREVRLRRLAYAAAVVMAGCLAALAIVRFSAAEPCADAGAPFAEVWQPGQLEGAADEVLAGYARTWGQVRYDVCIDTASGGASEALLDTRMRCLERRKREAAQVVAGLQAGRSLAEVAPILGASEVCRSIAEETDPIPPDRQAAIAEVERRLAEIVVRAEISGDYEGGLESAEVAVSAAVELGHRPLLAASLYHRARIILADATNVHMHDPELRRRGEADLEAAIRLAARAREDGLFLDGALFQRRFLAVHGEQPASGLALAVDADALFAGLTGAALAAHLDAQALAQLQRARGLTGEGRDAALSSARQLCDRALVLYEEAQRPFEQAKLLENRGDVRLELGDVDGAHADYAAAREIWQTKIRAGDPMLAELWARDINASATVGAPEVGAHCAEAMAWLPNAVIAPAARTIVGGRIALACAAGLWAAPELALPHARAAVDAGLPADEQALALEILVGVAVQHPHPDHLPEAEAALARLTALVGDELQLSPVAWAHQIRLWTRQKEFKKVVDPSISMRVQQVVNGPLPHAAAEVLLDLAEAHLSAGHREVGSLLDNAEAQLREARGENHEVGPRDTRDEDSALLALEARLRELRGRASASAPSP